MSEKYAGSEWLERSVPNISGFGREVADILGQTFVGIYHIDKAVLNKKVDWSNNRYIKVVIYRGLATFDYDTLTRLIVLSFDRMVRLEIEGESWHYLALVFTARHKRDGDISERLPILEDEIKSIRDTIGLPIIGASA